MCGGAIWCLWYGLCGLGDWQWIDILVQDWYLIGRWVNVCHCIGELVKYCHWIGGFVKNWHWIGKMVEDWRIGNGLADWHWIGNELTLHWQLIGLGDGLAYLLWAVNDGVPRHFGRSPIVLVPSALCEMSVWIGCRLARIGVGLTDL